MTLVAFIVLVAAFAALLTVHVTLAYGLIRRGPRWHAPVALVVAPLAPWWGWQAHMRVRGALWIAAAAVYAVALAVSLHG
ncbi:MAG TPA: hypothetical protein VGL81_15875 [Polyangiaceae bacterium]|jgi:hypothetical protein